MRKGIKIKYKLSLLLIASITLPLLLAGISLSFYLVQLHTHYARQQIHDAFITLEGELKSGEADLLNHIKTMSHREDIVSSVNMINEYQIIEDYKAIIFDVEKKKIAVEMAKQAEMAKICSVAVYDANKMLTAFAVREKEGYRLGIISFRDGRPKVYLSGTGNWDALAESPLPPMIGEINAGHLPKPDTIEYRETSSDFKMEAAFPIVRTLPDGTSKTVGFLKIAHFMGTDFVQDIAKKTGMNFQFFIDGKEGIGTFRDLAFSEQIRQSYSLFSEKQIQKVGWIDNDYYFLHSHFIPLEGGTRVYFVLGKEKTLLTAAIRKTKVIIVAVLLLSALIVTLAGVFIADRMISRPVTNLLEAVRAFKEGRYEKEIDVKTGDELGSLAHSFNDMALTIREREEELEKHREHLEEMVKERTAELAKTNQQLSRQMEERKRVEEVLRESKNGLAEAQRIAHIGNWALDLVKNELRWSDEIYQIFGLKPQQFGATYEAFLNTVHPDDREFVDTSYTKSVKSNTPYDIVHRIVRPDGEVRYVHEKAEDIKDETGKTIRSIGTVQDITERKEAEDAMEKRTTELQTMVNAMAGREVRMAELKETIRKLRAQLEEEGLTPVADDPLREAGRVESEE